MVPALLVIVGEQSAKILFLFVLPSSQKSTEIHILSLSVSTSAHVTPCCQGHWSCFSLTSIHPYRMNIQILAVCFSEVDLSCFERVVLSFLYNQALSHFYSGLIWQSISWGGATHIYLFTLNKETLTDRSTSITKVQLGEPVSFIWITYRTQRQPHHQGSHQHG